MLRAYEVQLKYGTQLDIDAIREITERQRVASPSEQRPVLPEIVPFEPSEMPPLDPQAPPAPMG